jgi:hypothetical protein
VDNVDPVGGIIGIAGLILAVAAFVIQSISMRRRIIIACGCLAFALIGISIVFLAALLKPSPDQVAQAPDTTTTGGGSTSTPNAFTATPSPSGSNAPTVGSSTIDPEIVTDDFRRIDETNSSYQLQSGYATLPFRYGWIARTADGDVTGDDCVVIAKLVDTSNGVVIANEPSNSCTVHGVPRSKYLPAGSYRLTIEIRRQGQSSSSSKDIVVRPA